MLQNKYLVLICLLICSLFSVNVIAIEQNGINPELTRSSIVVVAQPGFKFDISTRFAWADDYADISGKFKKSDLPVQKIIDSAIQQALLGMGYKFDSTNTSSLLIQYHVSLESDVDDMLLAIRYGLAPGLHANSAETKKYERGTLVVDLIDPQQQKVVWRGAIGVFTGLEKTAEGRQKRVNQLLVKLFSSVQHKAN